MSNAKVLKYFRTAKIFMGEISDMIQRLCPDGVEYRELGEVGTFIRGHGIQISPILRFDNSNNT